MLKKLIVTLLGIAAILGGLMMYNYFTGEKMTSQYEREQDKLALYLENHYENVESVEFLNFDKLQE